MQGNYCNTKNICMKPSQNSNLGIYWKHTWNNTHPMWHGDVTCPVYTLLICVVPNYNLPTAFYVNGEITPVYWLSRRHWLLNSSATCFSIFLFLENAVVCVKRGKCIASRPQGYAPFQEQAEEAVLVSIVAAYHSTRCLQPTWKLSADNCYRTCS